MATGGPGDPGVELVMLLECGGEGAARGWLNEIRARIPGALPEVRSDREGGWWIRFPAGAYGVVPIGA